MYKIDPELHNFVNAKMGDTVYDLLMGQGVITEIKTDTLFPLLVFFLDLCGSFQDGKRYSFAGASTELGDSTRLFKEPMQVVPASGRWIHVTSCRDCYYITRHGNLPDECMRFGLRIENYDIIHRGCKL